MNLRYTAFFTATLGLALLFSARAQQQPVLSVAIQRINVGGVVDSSGAPAIPYGTVFTGGTTFEPDVVTESFGDNGQTINIAAFATGTYLNSSYTYSFFVNGINIGRTSSPVAPPNLAVVQWTPPQPGSYFLTVTATDGSNTATSLPIRFFVTGTVINSPITNTLVPDGSSVVLKADAAVAGGFIKNIEFFDNGQSIGSDSTIPYSFIYKVPGGAGSLHQITARATDNEGNVGSISPAVQLKVVQAITPLPKVAISSPSDAAVIAIPVATSTAEPAPIPITVDATSPTGLIGKVELYIDGVLFDTKTTFPYKFNWTPTVVGTYRIVALASDDKNNVIASSLAAVLIAAPPSIGVVSPSNNGTIGGGVPTVLSAIATDSNVDAAGNPLGIASVQFFVDGTFAGTATTPSSGNIYSVTATITRKLDADGNPKPSVINAVATNTGGIAGTSSNVVVTVTEGGGGNTTIGEPPTVDVNWPAADTQLAVNKPVLVTAFANDEDGNIVSVQFFANNTAIGSTQKYPYSATWTPGSLGAYALTAKATDSDGNVVTSAPLRVSVIDPAPNPPLVKISSPQNGLTIGVGSSQTLRATATDLVSVASVQFFVNGDPLGAAVKTYPFTTSWSPATPGVYTISARALNASGNQTTSAPTMVIASEGTGDTVFTGTYQGVGEAGNFAVISGSDDRATLLAYSTQSGVAMAYRYADIAVDVAGGFALTDGAGRVLVSGGSGQTGTSGTFDAGRLTFIGMDTRYFPTTVPVASGYFKGGLSGRASSSVDALVGADGSIMVYVSDGAFSDAGSGKVDAAGSFNFASTRGNRFTGKADPVTRLLTGSLSGGNGGSFTGAPALEAGAANKVSGLAAEVGSDIYLASSGRTYDQVLLQGVTASVAADPGQVTRISFLDLSNDIVQVEFSGAGRLAITLENAAGPMAALNYNQPGVGYMKGHARLVVTGADETTNVSVFTVGKVTAGNQSLIKSNIDYDGVADIAYLAILSPSGKFGGIRTANANYVASTGFAGICAPGVTFSGPVYVGDINAAGSADPVILVGAAADVRVTGGDLWQANGRPVQVSGISRLKFVNGTTSAGTLLSAQVDKSRLVQEGVDVTTQVVVNPAF